MKCEVCGTELLILARYKPLPNFRFTVYYCPKCNIREENLLKLY